MGRVFCEDSGRRKQKVVHTVPLGTRIIDYISLCFESGRSEGRSTDQGLGRLKSLDTVIGLQADDVRPKPCCTWGGAGGGYFACRHRTASPSTLLVIHDPNSFLCRFRLDPAERLRVGEPRGEDSRATARAEEPCQVTEHGLRTGAAYRHSGDCRTPR